MGFRVVTVADFSGRYEQFERVVLLQINIQLNHPKELLQLQILKKPKPKDSASFLA